MNVSPVQQWGRSMRLDGCSERTIYRRIGTVTRYERETGRDLLTSSYDDIAAWLVRHRGKPWGPATRAAYFSDLSAFFTWAQRTGARELASPLAIMRTPRRPKGRPRPVNTGALMEVRAAAEGDVGTWIDLGAYQGLRVSEAAAVMGEHLDLRAGTIRIIGKGSNRRGPSDKTIPLHPVIAARAELYPRRGPWFPTWSKTGHMTGQHAGRQVQDLFAEHDVTMVFHQLRHWCGSALIAAGVNLRYVQEFLRHDSPTSTAIYTEVVMVDLAAAITLLPGPPGPLRPSQEDVAA